MIRRYGLTALAIFILFLIVKLDEANAVHRQPQYICPEPTWDQSLVEITQAIAIECERVIWKRKL
jgi:hypothetical protein